MKLSAAILMGTVFFGCENEVKVKTAKSDTAKSAVTYSPGSTVTVRDADDDTPILYLGDASSICSGVSFYNAAGEVQTGAASCMGSGSDGVLKPEYLKQGVTIAGITGTAVLASDIPEILPENIRAGVTIAGVMGAAPVVSDIPQFLPENIRVGVSMGDIAGTLVPSPVACSADGQINCVSNTSFPAAAATGLATKVAAGQTVAGVIGTFAGSYSNCAADGATACVATATYAAALTTGLAAKVVSGNTVAGVSGSATAESHSNCSSDGQAGCVVVGPAYAAAVTAGAASKILSGQSVAGIGGNVTLPAVGKVLTGTSYGVSGTGSSGTLTLPSAANVLTGSGSYGDPGAAITPSYNPDFPSVANVRAGDTVNGVSGTLADCASDGTTGCVATSTYTAALTTGLAAKVVSGNTVAGVIGSATAESHSNCSSDGQAGCVVVGPTYAAAVTAGAASKILFGQSVAGIGGNVTLPAVGKVLTGTSYGVSGTGSSGTLTLPSAANVLTGSGSYGDPGAAITPSYSPDFPSLANVRAGDTVNGVSGTLADCASDGTTGCVATATYTAALTTGLGAKVVSGNTVAGVSGSATAESHSNCTAGNQSGCVATATYKTMNLSAAGAATGLTAGNFNATLAATGNFEFWDASGARHSVAGDTDLSAGNIANAVVIHGVTGTATLESHANCASDGATGCVATATYTAALTTGLAAKVVSGNTVAGVGGSATAESHSSCSSNGSQSCVATGSYYAATNCAADGSNCYLPSYVATTQPLKAISYDAINTGKSSIRTSLTLSGIAGTLVDCSNNAATGCVTTASYQSADLTNLSAGNIKRGISIAGTTGNFPSATSPLPNYVDSGATTNTAGSDITDLSNFITQLTSAGSFEYWDSAGIRRTGSGDSDITAANVKNTVALENFSITGSYTGAASNCTGDGQTACTTTSTYKSVDTSALSVWDIRKGKSAGGISGSLTFYKNMANTSVFNRTSGTSAAAGLDIYDTIDDYNNNGSFPTQTPGGWDQVTGANWTQVVANTTYKDEITGLVWLKDQGSTYTWEQAITQCESSTAGSRSDWRLPTQRELMQAYTDGIGSQKTGLSLVSAYYWSASSVSYLTPYAWIVAPSYGGTRYEDKTLALYVVCVAP